MVDPVSSSAFSQLLNTINRNRSGLQDSLERISTGRRLNRAGTDAAASAANGLNSQIENLTQAESGLKDTDLAEEVTRLQQGFLRFETSIRALASQIQNEQSRARILDFSV